MSQIQQFRTAVIDFAGTGDNTAIAGVTNHPIKVWKIFFVADGATMITFQDGATALSGPISLSASGSLTLLYDGSPHFYVSPSNDFIINSSAGGQISGTVYYTLG